MFRINEEFEAVSLSDLRVLATLGVGGFGRVELVQIQGDANRSFALKQMKKSQVLFAALPLCKFCCLFIFHAINANIPLL